MPVTAQRRAAVTPESAVETIIPIDLSLIFKAWGFPAVRTVRNQPEAWDHHVGASQNPDLSDRRTATETLTEYTADHSFAHAFTDLTNVRGRITEGVRGESTLTPDHGETVISLDV